MSTDFKELIEAQNADACCSPGCCGSVSDIALSGVEENGIGVLAVREQVREHYARLAQQSLSAVASGCGCGRGSDCCGAEDAIPVNALAVLHDDAPLPLDIIQTSFGCGTPLELAALQSGETVLDLGSGGGLDCFYAAKLVGPSGRVIGVDMTPEMLELANRNRAKVGLDNVEFRHGYLEALPVASASIDVILSNCVINLSADKDAVLREAFRVLKPGGRVVFSDMVSRYEIPLGLRNATRLQSWAVCESGAITAQEYRAKMQRAGFAEIQVSGAPSAADIVYSARIVARKPDKPSAA